MSTATTGSEVTGWAAQSAAEVIVVLAAFERAGYRSVLGIVQGVRRSDEDRQQVAVSFVTGYPEFDDPASYFRCWWPELVVANHVDGGNVVDAITELQYRTMLIRLRPYAEFSNSIRTAQRDYESIVALNSHPIQELHRWLSRLRPGASVGAAELARHVHAAVTTVTVPTRLTVRDTH